MLKVLAPLVLLLMAGGLWWLSNSEHSGANQPGLTQAPEVETPVENPGEEADLNAPDSLTRSNSVSDESEPGAPRPRTVPDHIVDLDKDLPLSGSVMTVRAFIVDWSHRPVRDTPLSIGFERLTDGPMVDTNGVAKFNVESDAEGRIQTDLRFPEGGWDQVAIWIADEKRQAKGWVEPVRVILDGRGDLGTIQIFEAREKYPTPLITGRAMDESGKVPPVLFGSFAKTQEFEVELSALGALQTPKGGRDAGQVILEKDGRFQAYGPDTWKAAEITMLAPGYMNASKRVSGFPVAGVQLTLYRRLQLKGKLIVPRNGPPVHDCGVWLSQPGSGIGIQANADGSFSGQGTTQSLNLKISHPTMGTVLYKEEFVSPPDEETSLGTIDLRPLVQVVDFTLLDADGKPRANQKISIEAEELESIVGEYKTDADGRLLTLMPRHITSIKISKQGSFSQAEGQAVELLLPASPTRLTLP